MTYQHIDCNGRATGWRSDLESHVELQATAKVFSIANKFLAPEVIDHRAWLKIEDQGQIGSCAGHAMSSCCEVLNHIDTRGEKIELSRMWAYLIGQKHSGGNLLGRDAGATISGCVKGAKQEGICKEETFPYTGRYHTNLTPEAAKEAGEHKVLEHVVMRSYQQCFDWLASGVGVIEIGVPWTESLARTNGVINGSSGQQYGGHALAIVGYSERKDQSGRQYLWMANSHGMGWGNQGWAEVAPDLFDRWCRDQYSEVIGVSDLEEFAPRDLTWIGRMFG